MISFTIEEDLKAEKGKETSPFNRGNLDGKLVIGVKLPF